MKRKFEENEFICFQENERRFPLSRETWRWVKVSFGPGLSLPFLREDSFVILWNK